MSKKKNVAEVENLESWTPENTHISNDTVGVRLRRFVFTINTCDVDFNTKFNLKDELIQYFVAGFEVSPTTGRHHVQGYCELKKQLSFSTVKEMLPTAYIARAKGNAAQNTKYCMKDGCYVKQGEPCSQGDRNDLKEVLQSVKAGTSLREIICDNPNMQALRYAENCMKYFEPKRNFAPKVVWIYGRSGAGKSRMAREVCTEYLASRDPPIDPAWGIYEKNNFPLKWFDGYDGHPALVIDDIRPEFTKDFNFTMFLAMLDRYAYTVESKGSTRQLRAEVMVITSTLSPAEFADRIFSEDQYQIYRRLERIIRLDYALPGQRLPENATLVSGYSATQRSRVILNLDLLESPDTTVKKVRDFCLPSPPQLSIDEELELMF